MKIWIWRSKIWISLKIQKRLSGSCVRCLTFKHQIQSHVSISTDLEILNFQFCFAHFEISKFQKWKWLDTAQQIDGAHLVTELDRKSVSVGSLPAPMPGHEACARQPSRFALRSFCRKKMSDGRWWWKPDESVGARDFPLRSSCWVRFSRPSGWTASTYANLWSLYSKGYYFWWQRRTRNLFKATDQEWDGRQNWPCCNGYTRIVSGASAHARDKAPVDAEQVTLRSMVLEVIGMPRKWGRKIGMEFAFRIGGWPWQTSWRTYPGRSETFCTRRCFREWVEAGCCVIPQWHGCSLRKTETSPQYFSTVSEAGKECVISH